MNIGASGRDYAMQLASGTLYAIQERIITKLLTIDATSREKAVTAQEANLNVQEKNWLNYIAGGFLAKVKKTKDKKYYLAAYYRK